MIILYHRIESKSAKHRENVGGEYGNSPHIVWLRSATKTRAYISESRRYSRKRPKNPSVSSVTKSPLRLVSRIMAWMS